MTRESPYPLLPMGEAVLVCASIMFVVGSICFLPGPLENVRLGDLFFIVGSIIFLGKSVFAMIGQCQENGIDVLMTGHKLAEFCENLCYLAACIVFSGGCILWWPGIYGDNEELKLDGLIVASWMFIIGSMGFVVASFCNAVLLSKKQVQLMIPGKAGKVVYNLAFAALALAQLGGVFFVTGSYMYRPGFNNHCERKIRAGWDIMVQKSNFTSLDMLVGKLSEMLHISKDEVYDLMPETKWCLDISVYGTNMYIIGSCLYLIQSVLYLLMALVKERVGRKRDSMTDEELSLADSESEDND